MAVLLGGSHMQQQGMRSQRAAEAQPVRQAVHSCRVHRPQLQQQHALVSRPQQLESSHSRLLQPLQARRRSPVIAPDISYGRGEEQGFVDLFNYLLRQRIIFLSGYVNDKLSTQIVGSLLALEAMDEEAPIRLYINSPGGTPYAVIGVVDAMRQVKCPIQTVALGACYSYSSLILAAGEKGQRFSMKNTRIMMTQPMGGSQGDIYAIGATVQELNAIYQLYAKYYMKFTDMTVDEIEQQTCRDTFMTPEQAQDWGLIDDVYVTEGDMVTPPAVARELEELGFVDRLSGGVLRTGVV
uniref:ATP-dependent Clp protease proteolytic subunit n=1 Tax=Tetradesmus obliquus TaxID=3088 RepID=A0A383VDL0_TETOB|eukprot:jgi/Sobl393_1/15303/SZX63030.1